MYEVIIQWIMCCVGLASPLHSKPHISSILWNEGFLRPNFMFGLFSLCRQIAYFPFPLIDSLVTINVCIRYLWHRNRF